MSSPNDPKPGDRPATDQIETVIVPRTADIGDMEVRRALPARGARMVGPFIFFDQMGPALFKGGEGMDVRPHPHINLATVTYLLEGAIMHRDSLGTAMEITPGAVNWMSAGRGIVHSERTGDAARATGQRLSGLQTWVALPEAAEEGDPGFSHHPADALPSFGDGGVDVRLVAGAMAGARSPLKTASPTLFADVSLTAGAVMPIDPDYEERGLYHITGEIEIAGDRFSDPAMLILNAGDSITVRAVEDARFVLFGGAPMDGPRYIWWNFVSSRRERIEQAKEAWASASFDAVPGDLEDFIPLPEGGGAPRQIG